MLCQPLPDSWTKKLKKAQSLRTSARQAVVELQDDKALMSRPRVSQEFQAGELVAYWREQKYSHAQRMVVQGGCWHGTAMIIGRVKSDERAMFRPPAMREEDFIEVMREIVPRLVDQAVEQVQNPSTERTPAAKRERKGLKHLNLIGLEPLLRKLLLSCVILTVKKHLACDNNIHVLIAAHIQKKATKELPPTGNAGPLQQLVNESKIAEWPTIVEKGAVKLHFGKKAQHIREQFPDRFIGNRLVTTRKPKEEGMNIDVNDPNTYLVKSRWYLQNHLDPEDGVLQSPTLSQPSRVLLMQVLASYGWELQLGDIKGAFMEAGPLYRPLYAKIPLGGVLNVPADAVIEITGNVYGQNDAPCAWFKTFDTEAKAAGWVPSRFDPCLCTLRSSHDSSLIGILGVHVDDSAVGGMGPEFEASIQQLKQRFPYRKWRRGSGESCGASYQQDPQTMAISMMNGSLNRLANQSRPDLAAQASLSQQCFPNPTIHHLKQANYSIRRAKQHKDLTVKFQYIGPKKLTLCVHSDAAFANVGSHTQAGYVLAFVEGDLHKGSVSPWNPAVWRSYHLPLGWWSTSDGHSQWHS